MAFELRPAESVRQGLRRLARKELRSAAKGLADSGASREEAIHAARRSVKKVRAILDVFDEDGGAGLKKQRRRLRALSQALSALRDADVRVETFDRLRRRAPRAMSSRTAAVVRRDLVAARQQVMTGTAPGRLKKVRRTLLESRRAIPRWTSRHRNFGALEAAIAAAWREGRDAMRRARASGGADDYHAWRKAAKTLWYELRLIEAGGGRIRADIRALKRIEVWLGDDHNIVVLVARVFRDRAPQQLPADLDSIRRVAEDYQRQLRTKALERGRQVYAGRPPAYVARIKKLWKSSRKQ